MESDDREALRRLEYRGYDSAGVATVENGHLERRRAEWTAPVQPFERGYTRLYQEHVTQAHEGCDFDFLQGTDPTPEPAIF